MSLMPSEELSETLRKKRRRLDKTQGKIADLTGLSVSQISRIEKNSVNYTYSTAYKLWKTLEGLEKDSKTAREKMNSPVTWAEASETVLEIKKEMRENDFSQMPVRKNSEQVGRITEGLLLEAESPDQKIEELMGSKYSEIDPDTSIEALKNLLKEDSAVLVVKNGYQGILTLADVM
ncbi:MAG: CBS domain-containing protein [Candidatus Nanohaloarchaea archaeon]